VQRLRTSAAISPLLYPRLQDVERNFVSLNVRGLVAEAVNVEQSIKHVYKACSKKDRAFAIQTLFYNILSTVPFKVVPSTVLNVSSIVGMLPGTHFL
jgi:hypothetical protein